VVVRTFVLAWYIEFIDPRDFSS